jgi:VWFA-related protein
MSHSIQCALLFFLPATPQEPKPTFPAQTEVVTVDVVVTGRGGEPVLDLRREDFTVSEDGVPQEVVAFDAVHRPAPGPPAAGAPPLPPEPRTSSNRETPGHEAGSFVIVFDELHLDVAEAVRARKAVVDFLEKGVSERDRVAVVGTAEGTRWTARIPEGREALVQAVSRYQGKLQGEMVREAMTEYEAMRIDQDRDPLITDRVMRRFLATGQIRQDTQLPRDPPPDPNDVESFRGLTQARAADVYARATARNEQALGIIERSLESLAESRGRKSLVLVSGGIVQDPRLAIYHQVVNAARRANTAVYFLDVRGLVAATMALQADVGVPTNSIDVSTGAGLNEAHERSEGSEGLALDTGGFVVRNQNDLAAGLGRIGREARSYYLVGYSPTNRAADGKFRKIQVKVARPGVSVRARRGYYAPGKDDKKAAAETRDAAIQRALDAPFDLTDIPLRALTQVLGEAEPGKVNVLLTAEADIRRFGFAEHEGTSRDTLEALLLVARRDTGEYTRFDQQFEMSFRPETRARYERTWFPVTREMPLSPGSYQAKVVARDRNSGRVGTVTNDFEVPPPTGLRIATPILSDRLREEAAGGRLPEPTARRTFSPAGLLHCRFEVYGAQSDGQTGRPNVTAGLSVRRSDGRILVAMPETPLKPGPDGTLVRSLGMPLDGAPPGSYELIVLVTDIAAGQTAEAREPFVIDSSAEN